VNLGQDIINWIVACCLDLALLFIGLLSLSVIVLDFYNRYVKVNRNTDDIDLMSRYVELQMRRRYNGRTKV